MMREIELKYRFQNQQDFLAVLNAIAQKPWVENQTNYFFDTIDLQLKSQHIFLRLRNSNGEFKFTCKAKPQDIAKPNGNLSIHDEWEQPLEHAEVNALLSGSLSPLQILGRAWPQESENSKQTRLSLLERTQSLLAGQSLALVGSFQNTRTHMPYQVLGHELDLEFDTTDFGNHPLDYELEIEVQDGGVAEAVDQKLNALFTSLGVKIGISTGKAERFFSGCRPSVDNLAV